MLFLARTPVLLIVRNIFSDMSQTVFLQRILIRKRVAYCFRFSVFNTLLSYIFIRSYSSFLFFAIALHRLLFEFFFSLFFSLFPSLSFFLVDRRNDPLMENATVKVERFLSFTRTSSPATPFSLPSSSFLPSPIPALSICLSLVLVHSLFCFFFRRRESS